MTAPVERGEAEPARCSTTGTAAPTPTRWACTSSRSSCGGTGDAVGNANALASRWARDNTDRYRPITYGSSHIQAISFLDGGRVDARTILTYGQHENPHSPYSADQTRLFSHERWVRFAWTDAQIRKDLVKRYVVSAPAR